MLGPEVMDNVYFCVNVNVKFTVLVLDLSSEFKLNLKLILDVWLGFK